MSEPKRISPEKVRARKQSPDDDLMLVCAYDDEEKFFANQLQGAISLKSFRDRQHDIRRDRHIVFY